MPSRQSPNQTWLDLKQLLWAWLLILPFIALATYGARELLGWETALWMGSWLAALVTVTMLLIALVGFVLSALDEWRMRREQR